MKRRICALLTVFLLSSLLCLSAAGETVPEGVVFDRAGLLTADERDMVKTAVLDAWEVSDCGFYLATHDANSQTSTNSIYIGDDFLYDQGLSSDDSIVLLIITLDRGVYYYDLYTYGDAYDKISQKEVDYMLDHKDVYDNIKGGRLALGICSFMPMAAQAFEGRVGVSYLVIALISLGIAVAIGLIACISVRAAYTMKKKSVDYPLDRFARLKLTDQSDVFMGSFVTKRVIQSNSGKSGGGSSHGGGGGHRGGR